MKRANHLIGKIADFDNLLLAFWKAGKGKQGKAEVHRFRVNLHREIAELRHGILDGTLRPGNYHYFKIHDPKERLICAASFRERVLHHAIMNVCEPHFERYLIDDTYACRKGRGSHKAVCRAQHFCRSCRWYLSLDIRKYFDSIDHGILLALLERRFKDRRLIDLFRKIVSSYETAPGTGIPIGNLTSQYFANHYLGVLDHFVKEHLRVRPYVRYMDNFVLWSDSKSELKGFLRLIRAFLRERLALELNDSVCLNRVDRGVGFLGYRVFPDRVCLGRRSRRRFVEKFRRYEHAYLTGEWTSEDLQRHMLPLLSFTRHASSHGFRAAILHAHGALS